MGHPQHLLQNAIGNPTANVAPAPTQIPYQQQVQQPVPAQMQPQAQPNQDPNLAGWPTNEQVLQDWQGPNGIAYLNQYAVGLENQVQEQEQVIQRQHQTLEALEPHMARYEALENLAFDPDQLAEYTAWAFGPEGPWPVEQPLPQGQMQYDHAGNPIGMFAPQQTIPVQEPQYQLPPEYQMAPQMQPQVQAPPYQQGPYGVVPGQNAVNPTQSIQDYNAELAALAQQRDQMQMTQQAVLGQPPMARPNFPGGYPNQGSNASPADLLGQTLATDPSRTPDLVSQLFNNGSFMNTTLVHEV